MIGEAIGEFILWAGPVARERDNKRCHGFVWSQGGLVIDCVESPEFSTSPFVSKPKSDVSEQPSKGGCITPVHSYGASALHKRKILGLVRSRHSIGQPLPCMKQTYASHR